MIVKIICNGDTTPLGLAAIMGFEAEFVFHLGFCILDQGDFLRGCFFLMFQLGLSFLKGFNLFQLVYGFNFQVGPQQKHS